MEVTGLTAEQVSVAIARLKRLDMVYENNYSFYLTDRRRDSSRKSEPAPPNAVQEQPAEDTVPATPPAPAPPASVTDIVHQISDLVVQLASGSNAGELEQLRVQVATLRTENEKLVRQNKALRAAIAAMEE